VRVLEVDPWRDTFDLIGGLAGYGVYFLERLRGGAGALAREGLARVVDHLAAMARREPDGAAWFTPPELLPPTSLTGWPRGVYNCGLAHGAPAVIAVLSRAAALPDPPPAARALRDDAARWLIARRGAPTARGHFPASIADGVAEPARTAWCYGDPGVACGLWDAAPAVAYELALDCARREVEHCVVRDAGLCHGAAGLAHLLGRWYHATGDARLADAARAWLERTLAFRTPAGFAGIVRWGPDESNAEANLVEGAIGVALTLLAATGDCEPGWDRMLLCDVATAPRRYVEPSSRRITAPRTCG
jgi:hypothetical protein